MITAAEARVLTLENNKSIMERVDELLEKPICQIIKAKCEQGETNASYYFDVRQLEPKVVMMSLIEKLQTLGYTATVIYSLRDMDMPVGISISW